MEVSRLTFTDETKKRMTKGLTKREKGRLRFERLKEAAEDGRLQRAKTRAEVAHLAGFTRGQYKTGYSWVMNMLTRKHLFERISGMAPNGRAEYEYTLGPDPIYGVKTDAVVQHISQKKDEMAGKCYEVATEEPKVLATPNKVTIKYGELSIELEQISAKVVAELVTDLLNKVIK